MAHQLWPKVARALLNDHQDPALTPHQRRLNRFFITAPLMLGHRTQEGLFALEEPERELLQAEAQPSTGKPKPSSTSSGIVSPKQWHHWPRTAHSGLPRSEGTHPVLQDEEQHPPPACPRQEGHAGVVLHCACDCGLLEEHQECQKIDWEEVWEETEGRPWLLETELTCNATLMEYHKQVQG